MKSIPRDLGLVVFSLFLWSLGEGLFFHFQPLYIQSFGADPAQIGAVLGIASVALMLCHLPAGYIADRFGRRPVMLAGWVLGLVACLIMYQARSLEVFTVGLVLYNATAFAVAANNSYLTAARGRLSVERALTFSAAGYGTGAIISPAIGGMLAGSWGLRALYGAACLVFTLSCLVLMRISPQKTEHPPEEGRYNRLISNSGFRRTTLLAFGVTFAMYLGIALAPNYLRDARSLPIASIGLLGSANAVGIVVLNGLFGRWHPRRGFLISQVLFMLYAVLLWQGTGFAFFLVAYFLRSSFSGARSTITAQAGRVVGSREMGMAYAMMETMGALAFVLAPAAAGLLYERSPESPLIASLGLTALMLVLSFFFAPKEEGKNIAVHETERSRRTRVYWVKPVKK